MATNIPPHNLGEVISAVCALIDNPSLTVDQLLEIVKGSDLPTGCTIYGTSGIRQYFETGRGIVRVRGKATIEEGKQNREILVITEIPYNVNRAELIKRIAGLIQETVITAISDIRNPSDEDTRSDIKPKLSTTAK